MRSRGLTPIITLNHFTLPLWVSTPPMEFSRNLLANVILPPKMKHLPLVDPIAADPYWKSLKGWESHRTVDAFIKYVSKMVNEFKDIVDYWITLNEPQITRSSQLEDCCQRIVNGNPVKIDVISASSHSDLGK